MESNWISQAYAALRSDDFHSAAYAAREAAKSGDTAETWHLKSRANLGLGNGQDALYEARQATVLDSRNAGYHFHLGLVSESLSDDSAASHSYQTAASLDPTSTLYRAAYAGTLASLGQLEESIAMLRSMQSVDPNDSSVNTHLAIALLEKAESVVRVKEGDEIVITSKGEVDQIRALAGEAKALTPDSEMKGQADLLLNYAAEMEQSTLRLHNLFLQRGGPVRWGVAVVALFVVGVFACTVSTGFGATMLFASLLLAAMVFGTAWVPRWKANARNEKAMRGRTF